MNHPLESFTRRNCARSQVSSPIRESSAISTTCRTTSIARRGRARVLREKIPRIAWIGASCAAAMRANGFRRCFSTEPKRTPTRYRADTGSKAQGSDCEYHNDKWMPL